VSAETRAVLEQLLFEEQIPDVDVDRTIARIRDEQRKETLRGLVARLVDAERSGDIDQVRALQNEIQRVTSPENRAAGDTITS
jgi:phage/plasmid-associated DNA primase